MPELILNNTKKNLKVITTIESQLKKCDEFYISVAFITQSGITPLLQTLKQLEEKNIKGKILTSDYLYFSQPEALEKLNQFKNIEVKLYSVDEKDYGFHTKGYIFKNNRQYSILIGSSNLTQKALTVNKEWNLLTTQDKNTELYSRVLDSFNEYWKNAIDLDECIEEYRQAYNQNKQLQKKDWIKVKTPLFTPNKVQKEFVKNLKELVDNGDKRGLFISATGTGKTLASAFGIKELNARKILFLVHREQIAKQSLNSYRKVFKDKNMGLISGNHKDFYADFIFSTVQMMSKEDIYTRYDPEEFDVIVIDEVHHAGADSYQKIMNYFKPEFYLGMTATPERSDQFDIYSLFSHNIIHEIRLKDAMESDLLCNFNYFGITDKALDVNDTSDQRVDHIIENIEFYGYNGDRLKGLVFCNNVKNAQILSEKFNQRGYKTVSLSGSDDQKTREDYIKRLVCDNCENYLDYIFTVDIFNEGVDIKEVNQIVMLRETKSSIIFTQQLGRGLRKCENKEFVVVLDFIGNYRNNFMIPIALSGDLTYNKDMLRKFTFNQNSMVVGSSTVNFDKIAKERIYTSIDKVKFNINFFKNEYLNLKNKIGRSVKLSDFYFYNQLDPVLIVKYIKKNIKGYKTYNTLLDILDCEYVNTLSDLESAYLEFVTLHIFDSKRLHDLLILKNIIENNTLKTNDLEEYLNKNYDFNKNDVTIKNAIRKLNKEYFKPPEKKQYKQIEFIQQENNIITIHSEFKQLLENADFKENMLDLINLGIDYYNDKYDGEYLDDVNFKLYNKYNKWDMACLLNWYERDPVYGYVIKENILDNNNKTCPICITYDHYNHVNEFKDKKTISWVTTTPRTLESKDIKQMIEENDEIEFLLFIKKNNDDGREFYYMGPVKPVNPEQGTLNNSKGDVKDTVYFDIVLKYPVRDDIYDYIIS